MRWELDLRGFKDVKLFASGGLDEKEVMELKPLVDAFGVGTSISNAPVVDFSMDIMEIDGRPLAKRGKWSGAKEVLRCKDCFKDKIIPLGSQKDRCECGGEFETMLLPLIENGKVVRDLPKPKDIREYALKGLKDLNSPV